jgi:hypothetical protein
VGVAVATVTQADLARQMVHVPVICSACTITAALLLLQSQRLMHGRAPELASSTSVLLGNAVRM